MATKKFVPVVLRGTVLLEKNNVAEELSSTGGGITTLPGVASGKDSSHGQLVPDVGTAAALPLSVGAEGLDDDP
ncbi:MAG TPA: hypothetical protein VE991_00855, partial [Acidimicrobiales bacterium]|nr:hypothetical protein [Acidimicrobiales bacterium]